MAHFPSCNKNRIVLSRLLAIRPIRSNVFRDLPVCIMPSHVLQSGKMTPKEKALRWSGSCPRIRILLDASEQIPTGAWTGVRNLLECAKGTQKWKSKKSGST